MGLNNALSNAASSLLGNLGGLINGQNPLVQPQVAQLLGTNIPAFPLISTRDYFLAQLNSWITTPALQSQWICVIDQYPRALYGPILRNLERTGGDSNAYDISLAKSLLTSYPFQRVAGCIFANQVSLPEESYSVESVSVDNNRGFIPGVVSSNRASYDTSPLTLGFYEGNTSFIDFVIRPWVMLASHYGHVTRKTDEFSVKCNITLLFYNKTFQNISMIPRKVYRFYNCVPTQVAVQEYDYDEPTSVTNYTARFSYTNYTISNNLYLPLPQIIASAKAGRLSLPIISPLQGR